MQLVAQVLCTSGRGLYIWQLEALEMHCSCEQAPPWQAQQGQAACHPPCIWGTLRWGDNVDDEWLVVCLIRACTAAIPHISAQVRT